MKKNKQGLNSQDLSLEKIYKEIFKDKLLNVPLEEDDSLEQPSVYKFVQTVTTYGAYQSPL